MPVTGNVKRLSSRHSNSASAYPRSFNLGYFSCSDSFIPAMQEPFPALTFLHLCLPLGSAELTLPETLLGGSAPQLRSLFLNGVSFPALPKLLLSTGHLVSLPLHDSSIEWYILPRCWPLASSRCPISKTFPSAHPMNLAYFPLSNTIHIGPHKPTQPMQSFLLSSDLSTEVLVYIRKISSPELPPLYSTASM